MSQENKVTVKVNPNGPLLVQGSFTLSHGDTQTEVADKAFLCRCGASSKKPFCDGSHKAAGFTG